MNRISKRLSDLIDELPLKNNLKLLEIGCGSGVAAREIVNRFNNIFVLGIDRSAKALKQATISSSKEIEAGKIKYLQTSIEKFEGIENEIVFDFAFAFRVGALDGRHPEIEEKAKENIKRVLKTSGKLYIDKDDKLFEINL